MPRTQLSPLTQSELKLHFAPVAPCPVVLHLPAVHVRLPQQSAFVVQFWLGPTHAVRHLPVVLPVAIAHTGADSQQPPLPKLAVHDWSAQPLPVAASQRPRRQLRPVQQSVSAPHELPSPPQMPRQALPARLPVAVQYGASAQQPPCAYPCVQIE
jgi:hypothetical protein